MPSILKKIHILVLSVLVFAVLFGVNVTNAQVSLEKLPDAKVYNDFVVGPGKVEVEMNPGETRIFQLSVSNRLGVDKIFTITKEDFKGSRDPGQTVILLGDDRGPYSLRDYVQPATSSLEIPHGYKARITIQVTVPYDAQPGGLYGSVIVGTASKPGTEESLVGAAGNSPIIARIGTLFFVRVRGDVEPNGHLSDFSVTGKKKLLFEPRSVVFDILYQNDGNVHLDPAGTIDIENLLGSTVSSISVEPWFAMPASLRFRQVEWKPPFLFGRYVAHAHISRGYGSTTDEMSYVFWVIPWKILLVIFIALVIVITLFRFVFSRFSIVSKKSK